ncbi:MAG: hypothetical protein DHS20C18_06150 [Saprospiraceae bacterium]|nr:MAG: hypothetical protein DHS20C18_06150 [Saprospiraceae bacterium]
MNADDAKTQNKNEKPHNQMIKNNANLRPSKQEQEEGVYGKVCFFHRRGAWDAESRRVIY